jgi:hypothetical protein
MAEATARELGRISLEESLALTALVAEKDPERRSRFAVGGSPAARGRRKVAQLAVAATGPRKQRPVLLQGGA